MRRRIGVLGPVAAWDAAGAPLVLPGPRHRAVLARLVAAHGRVVGLEQMVDDLWEEPPARPEVAVRTFVAALRRALEPDRAPRQPPEVLLTVGSGYRLDGTRVDVDAWELADLLDSSDRGGGGGASALEAVLDGVRGEPLAGVGDSPWVAAERERLTGLLDRAEDLRVAGMLADGRAGQAVAHLEVATRATPWREDRWRWWALALHRSGRQADALRVLREAGTLLRDDLGLEPSPALARLEVDILNFSPDLELSAPDDPWRSAVASYEDEVVSARPGARLRAAASLVPSVAVASGAGHAASREQRARLIAAASELGPSPEAVRIIEQLDVPVIWAQVDDEDESRRSAAAVRDLLAAHGSGLAPGLAARLHATLAVEVRGVPGSEGPSAAAEADRLARISGDPRALAHALNARYLHSYQRGGTWPERRALGKELVAVSSAAGLDAHEVLGHLVLGQHAAAHADRTAARGHADAADRLAIASGLPLVHAFTAMLRATCVLATSEATEPAVRVAYADALALLGAARVPGMTGVVDLARIAIARRFGPPEATGEIAEGQGWGRYRRWGEPVRLLAEGRVQEARGFLRALPDPPPDALQDVWWCLLGETAAALGDDPLVARCADALAVVGAPRIGAGSGLVDLGGREELLGRWGSPSAQLP